MGNRIHPTAIIGEGVELGSDNVIGPYTVIVGPCRMGDGNWIAPHVSIGGPAEYYRGEHPVGWEGEVSGPGVVIGNGNKIREYAAINQGIHETTRVGDACYLMARSQIAHDCVIGDGVVLTSAVQLAGHCQVWSGANLGLGTVVHQWSRIGPGAMLGMGCVVTREVPAFSVNKGVPARATGVNVVGLSRRGCSDDVIEALRPYLAGETAEIPAGTPDEVAALLKAWAERPAQS